MRSLREWVLLPDVVGEHERAYLEKLHPLAIAFFFAHVPVLVLVAVFHRTGAWQAALASALVAAGPWLAKRSLANPRHVGRVAAVAAMGMAGLLVYFGRGPLQIEMHLYFFVLLALLIVFADPLAILVAAALVPLHDVLLWAVYPRAVFNYDASFVSVSIHGLLVVLEATSACFVARAFYDARVGLESQVAARTNDLAQRTSDLKLILDNIGQGLFVFDRRGLVFGERSAVVESWLGPIPPSRSIVDWIGGRVPSLRAAFALGVDALGDGFMPLAIVLDQLPTRILVGDRILEARYRPTERGIVAVLSDVTAAEEARRAEAARAATLVVVENLLRDRDGFMTFFTEAEWLAVTIFDPSQPTIDRRRAIHTMKGNSALFGLSPVVDACAEIEEVGDAETPLRQADLAKLREVWAATEQNVWRLAGVSSERIAMTPAEHALLLGLVRARAPFELIEAALADLKFDAVEDRLTRLADQARHLASHLGRAPVDVVVDTAPIRVDAAIWAPIWNALVHVIRNSVDHGLETSAERRAAGKAEHARMNLRARVENDDVICEISDDGRGIDWDRVAVRAARRGLPHQTLADLHEALFADGLSTRDGVSAISGHGIGMGAIRAACHAAGGELNVVSELGRGTRVVLRVPRRGAPASSPRRSLRPVSAIG